jgi:hypothetical protein
MDDKELESLRDLYAGLAMLGLVASKNYRQDHVALIAFEFADSMLEARTGKGIVSVKSPIPEGE